MKFAIAALLGSTTAIHLTQKHTTFAQVKVHAKSKFSMDECPTPQEAIGFFQMLD